MGGRANGTKAYGKGSVWETDNIVRLRYRGRVYSRAIRCFQEYTLNDDANPESLHTPYLPVEGRCSQTAR